MSSSNQDGETTESKKPKDTPFSQQQLPAWQPILTPGTVLPTFFVIGIAFLAIGVGLLYFSNDVKETVIEYTDCKQSGDDSGEMCHDVINRTTNAGIQPECICKVRFELKEDWPKDVYMYYALTNFYQNHRRYVKSRDEKQLLGDIEKTPDADCNPYEKVDGSDLPVVPCGAIANSLFNDKIELTYNQKDPSNVDIPVELLRTGIAWESDKKYKFKNPVIPQDQKLQDVLEGKVAKPKDWKKNLWELDPDDENNNGLQNEDLIVWMRTAAFPNFRKLYRRINHNSTNDAANIFSEGLKKGDYTLTIDYNFKVKQFSGTKSVVLSQTSILGGKNPFLGIAYIVVGCICLVVGIVFLIIHIKCGKVTNDMIDMGRGGGGIRN